MKEAFSLISPDNYCMDDSGSGGFDRLRNMPREEVERRLAHHLEIETLVVNRYRTSGDKPPDLSPDAYYLNAHEMRLRGTEDHERSRYCFLTTGQQHLINSAIDAKMMGVFRQPNPLRPSRFSYNFKTAEIFNQMNIPPFCSLEDFSGRYAHLTLNNLIVTTPPRSVFLTPAKVELLEKRALGMSGKQIADSKGGSASTVKNLFTEVCNDFDLLTRNSRTGSLMPHEVARTTNNDSSHNLIMQWWFNECSGCVPIPPFPIDKYVVTEHDRRFLQAVLINPSLQAVANVLGISYITARNNSGILMKHLRAKGIQISLIRELPFINAPNMTNILPKPYYLYDQPRCS